MKVRALLAGFAVLAVLAAGCSTSTTETDARIDEAFASVLITVGAGDVTVERTTGRVEWFATAEFSGQRPAFEPTVVGGVLVVDDGCAGGDGCSVRYTIRVPESTSVEGSSGSGDIRVTGLIGSISVVTVSGTVFLNTVNGTISVESRSGDIVGTKLVAAIASFDSSSGDIDVAFENVIPDLVVDAGSGNVTAQLAGGPYNLDTETISGATDFKIDDDNSAPNMIVLRTTSGDLTVYRQ